MIITNLLFYVGKQRKHAAYVSTEVHTHAALESFRCDLLVRGATLSVFFSFSFFPSVCFWQLFPHID
jgi:hypothetical protein